MLIDTHAHLQMKDYKSDLDRVLERAKEAGVDYIINSSFDIPSSKDAVKLAEKWNVAIVGFVRGRRMNVYTAVDRIL